MPPITPPRNLRELLRVEPRLDPSRVARILGDLAGTLGPRHARGEAHGALTPEQVRFDAAGRATVAPPPDDGAPAPWPAYLSPEQIDGRPADARSDVYALGLLGWEMLAGHAPWAGESLYAVVLRQREQELPPLATLRPGLPPGLVRAIEGALPKQPAARWQGAHELLVQLRDEAEPTAGTDRAASPPAVTEELPVPPPARPVVEAPRTVPRRVVAPEASRSPAGARMTDAVVRDARRADAPPVEERPAIRASRASDLRPLGLVALAIAVLGAGMAGVAVMQGRQESSSTRAWLDSVASGASGEVVAETTLTMAEARVREQARRDSLARRARLLAVVRRDSARRAREDSVRLAAESLSADSLAAAAPAATPVDSATPPDTVVPPDTVARDVVRVP